MQNFLDIDMSNIWEKDLFKVVGIHGYILVCSMSDTKRREWLYAGIMRGGGYIWLHRVCKSVGKRNSLCLYRSMICVGYI